MRRIIPIQGTYQEYAWGKEISSSTLNAFTPYSASPPSSGIAAELWFGIHNNGCSKILHNEEWIRLDTFIQMHEWLKNYRFDSLAKILTINKPLSIQLHPDKENAITLHSNQPTIFPDSNPKPEMAIALTEVELLCGIRPSNEIDTFVNEHPLAKYYLPADSKEAYKTKGVKSLLERIFNLSCVFNKQHIEHILSQASHTLHDKIAFRVLQNFEHIDAGILALYILSHHVLKPGESIFIKPLVPHAYLKGDLFECMMNSDNVVRGGLTNKPIDKENFLLLVNEEQYSPITTGTTLSTNVTSYNIPELPFILEKIEVSSPEMTELRLTHHSSHQIIITMQGDATLTNEDEDQEIHAGNSHYIPPTKNSIDSPMILRTKNLLLFRVIEKETLT